MRKILYISLLWSSAIGQVPEKYAAATERGYEVIGDSVQFPDSSKCSIDDFNSYSCGQKWYDVDYCVEKGKLVWNKKKCCDGLVATKQSSGNYTCESEKKELSWYQKLFDNGLFWIGLSLPFIFLLYISLSVKRRIRNDNSRR